MSSVDGTEVCYCYIACGRRLTWLKLKKSIFSGLDTPIVRAHLAIFAGDLFAAEESYVRRGNRPELAVNMYKQFNKWSEAIALAERTDRASVATLKQQHMDYLTSTGLLYLSTNIIHDWYNELFVTNMKVIFLLYFKFIPLSLILQMNLIIILIYWKNICSLLKT